MPIDIIEYDSGEKVYDWSIPPEYNIKDGWIKNSHGEKLIDFKKSNLHVMNYSVPIKEKITFNELSKKLYYCKNISNAIPYRTSYYTRDWGFCLTKNQYDNISKEEGLFDIYIDSELNNKGSMTIGELLIPGKIKKEILISTYICHPSLANDNLSGMLMTAFLARELLKLKNLKFSYRILWVPETIGAIAYSAFNEDKMRKINTGLVVTCVGGPGKYGYKQSYDREHSINTIIEKVFKKKNIFFEKYPFDINGSDERQYSSQGFRINCASITKDKYYNYLYYHTSLDNLNFIDSQNMYQSLRIYFDVLIEIDNDDVYKNLYPNCEVMLSKFGLYPNLGGAINPEIKSSDLDIILWLLWSLDGQKGIKGIQNKFKIPTKTLQKILRVLLNKKIIKKL